MDDTATRKQFVGTSTKPGKTPEQIKLVVSEIGVRSPAEIAANIIPSDYRFSPGDIRRYGIVPNDVSSASTNTASLIQILDPQAAGLTGRICFPSAIGNDIYYFNDRIPIRDGVTLDLCGNTLSATKAGTVLDTNGAFLHALRDVTICNGKIDINYTQTAGTNTFNAMAFGVRSTITDYPAFFDNNSPRLGNIHVHNIDINMSGGTNSNGIFMLSGLRNCLFENIAFEGNGSAKTAVFYEFGFATDEAVVEDRQSSHAENMVFRNWEVSGVDDTAAVLGTAFRFGGANSVLMENIVIRGATNGILMSVGEALYFRPWNPESLNAQPRIAMRNITISEVEGVTVGVGGANENTGYLSGISISDQDLTDLIDFDIDGFSILGGAAGTTIGIDSNAGKSLIRNGTIRSTRNALRFGDEAVNFAIDNVDVFDSISTAMGLGFSTGVFAIERKKTGSIRNCFLAGNEGVAISIDHVDNVVIAHNRFGYTLEHDGVAETTQDAAIQCGADATIICDSNYVAAVANGLHAYTGISGALGILINPLGRRRASAHWVMDNLLNSAVAVGDSNRTLTAGADQRTQRFTITLTQNRVVTLSTTDAVEGDKFRIVRTGLGSFTLDVGGLKTIPNDTAAFVDVMIDGGVWVLTGYGEL